MHNIYEVSEYEVLRSLKCDGCGTCVRQCGHGVHFFDANHQLCADEMKCVNCQRCVVYCHAHALKIIKNRNEMHPNDYWSESDRKEIYKQATQGGILLSSMGANKKQKCYFDHLMLNASQVTNPSIDPLREPMETKVFLGKKNRTLRRDKNDRLILEDEPYLTCDVPILFSAMSLGAISYNAHLAMLEAAKECLTYYNAGEGGVHPDFFKDKDHIIAQVASGRFGIDKTVLDASSAVEIKIGQGAKPGIGGHLPSSKNTGIVSKTRMIRQGSEAISPAPHHDIYSIEDLHQLVMLIKEATCYTKPVIVKVAAVHNISAITSGIARSGADIICIDGYRGGSGATPTRIRDNVGIPIELALASVDERLREEGIRDQVSLVISGGIRNSADVVKAIALGADAVAIGTSALLALGCHLCQSCHTGICNWGIATQKEDLCTRLNPQMGKEALVNLIHSWTYEIKEMMGGMGINSIEALKGNRLMLAAVDLNEKECEILKVRYAGE